jgi:hypothetical protein
MTHDLLHRETALEPPIVLQIGGQQDKAVQVDFNVPLA